jgi:hypothetical protein
VPWSHVTQHPELALAGSHRDELGRSGHLGAGAGVDPGPPVQQLPQSWQVNSSPSAYQGFSSELGRTFRFIAAPSYRAARNAASS